MALALTAGEKFGCVKLLCTFDLLMCVTRIIRQALTAQRIALFIMAKGLLRRLALFIGLTKRKMEMERVLLRHDIAREGRLHRCDIGIIKTHRF